MNFYDKYIEFLKFASKRQKKQSFETLRNNFNTHILPYFEKCDIREIKKRDYLSWQNEILSHNFSNSYNNTLYVEFSSFLNYCCQFYDLEINVAKEVGNFPKKVEEKKTDFYTLDEFNHFIKYVDNNIYKQFFNLMFFTGTRPGEAMALKFSDIKDDYITINKTLTTKGGRTINTPKNKSSIRKIKIDKKLKRDIEILKKEYIKKYKNRNVFDLYIFGGIKPLAPTTINRYKIKACEKANIRPITLHQFRHSHATLLLNNGILINEVSRRLGHSKTSTTLDIYTHTSLEQEKRVLNTLNSMRFSFFETLRNNFKKIISILKHI